MENDMKTSENIINGVLFHKVIPESDDESKLAQVFLSKDGDGAFSDMGDGKCWKKFISAADNLRQAKKNADFNELFDGRLQHSVNLRFR